MQILVYADWIGLTNPLLMGTLHTAHIRGKEIFSFEYSKTWLDSTYNQLLDPDLQFFKGMQYLSGNKKNFDIFLDSSPDRWGRVLIERREAIIAKIESRKTKTFFEEDYLLGVFDMHRMGALRFKTEASGPFLNDNLIYSTPPWTSLRELEFASLQLEKDRLTDKESLKWLNILLAPGSSLGGARPKASITDERNHLWIAKFPSINDKINVGAWEMVTNTLAKKAGIKTTEAKVQKFNSKHHTFLTKRFDRNTTKKKIHFASAMTLLGYSDGAEGISYIELAEFIVRNGANVNEDLEELWRRIIFNIAVKNTDDHLRNHGFILSQKGWLLSPAFDMNPTYHGKALTLNISENDNSLDFDLAISVSKYFRVKPDTGEKIIRRIKKSVSVWKENAKILKLPNTEIDLMAQAFESAG